MVHGLALGVGPTRRRAGTRVYALTVDAGVCGRAVGIGSAPRKAQSPFTNVVPRAEGIGRTNQTTPLLNAALVVEALVVAAARNSANGGLAVSSESTLIVGMAVLGLSDTFKVCVSHKARWTSADLLVGAH